MTTRGRCVCDTRSRFSWDVIRSPVTTPGSSCRSLVLEGVVRVAAGLPSAASRLRHRGRPCDGELAPNDPLDAGKPLRLARRANRGRRAMPREFDAIVIGTGQSGPSLARRMAGEGWKVAVLERGQPGGTCVNTGCIPTKTLVSSAKVAAMAR